MRWLGVDYGRRRIGLAVSDASGILARPWQTVTAGANPAASAVRVQVLLAAGPPDFGEDGAVGGVIVGLPLRLNGAETNLTPAARAFAAAFGRLTGLPVHLQDERLSSHEADARLGERERDWRVRKRKLDAAAAAIILQDFLDQAAHVRRAGDEDT